MPLVIANPKSGCARHLKKTFELQLRSNRFEIQYSQDSRHAESMAYDASVCGENVVVAAGGDGTIHAVVNGLLRNPKNQTRLGLLPLGTANDLVWSMKRQFSDQACVSQRIDVGVLRHGDHERYFLNVAGIGLSARVAEIARKLHRWPATLKYSLALSKSCGREYGVAQVKIAFNDNSTYVGPLLMMSCANGKREGSFALSPLALLNDGHLDILQVGKLRRFDLVRYFPSVLRGVIPQGDSRICERKATRLEILSSTKLPIHLDGESLPSPFHTGLESFSIESVTNAIYVECWGV